MGYSYFAVDTSVWQDGITFNRKAEKEIGSSAGFKQAYETVAEPVPEEPAEIPVVTPSVLIPLSSPLAAQELGQKKIQELPASLADVQDLTPFVVSADSKPGTRLDAELKRTAFSSSKKDPLYRTEALQEAKNASPYNMSEKTAQRKETARTLKGPGDSKMFSMETVSRYTKASRALPAFNVAKAPDSAKDGNQVKIQPFAQNAVQQQAKPAARTIAEETVKPAAAPVDVEAIRAQKSSDIGYRRDSMPSMSSEKTSAAASWFPEAMTRTLDMYEAVNKVAANNGTEKKIDQAI